MEQVRAIGTRFVSPTGLYAALLFAEMLLLVISRAPTAGVVVTLLANVPLTVALLVRCQR